MGGRGGGQERYLVDKLHKGFLERFVEERVLFELGIDDPYKFVVEGEEGLVERKKQRKKRRRSG